MRSFADVGELRAAVGDSLGPSEWLTIDQKRVDGFADATDDHQWIHVDPDAADSPFGGTIAHGYLILSLAQKLAWDTYSVGGVRIAMNTGSNKVRYLAPVPVGSRIRASSEVVEVTDVDGGVQAVVRYTVEIDGSETPACVAETLMRYYL